MKILKASFKNYKGLRKVAVDSIYEVLIPDHTNIHSIYGENGTGKSTMVGNLNPFIFPNEYSGKSTSDFMDFPGFKKIEFMLGGDLYLADIQFISKSKTTAQLSKKKGSSWVVENGYESGKTTTYSDLIENLFGNSQRNIGMINYIGQNTNAIIEANPKTRRELITPLIGSLDEHEIIIRKYTDLEKVGKDDVLMLKGEMAGISGKISDENIDQLPTKLDVENIEVKIGLTESRIEETTAKGKSWRGKSDSLVGVMNKIEGMAATMKQIKSSDMFDGFPNKIDGLVGVKNVVELRTEREKIVRDNTSKELSRVNIERSIAKMVAERSSCDKYNNELLNNHDEKEILGFDKLDTHISKINGLIEVKKLELKELTVGQNQYEKNQELVLQKRELSALIITVGDSKRQISEAVDKVRESIYDVNRPIDKKVSNFVNEVVEDIEGESNKLIVGSTYKRVFGRPVNMDEKEQMLLVNDLSNQKIKLEDRLGLIEKNYHYQLSIEKLNHKIIDGCKDNTSVIKSLAGEVEINVSRLGELSAQRYLVDARKNYISNVDYINAYDGNMKILKDSLGGLGSIDLGRINSEIETAERISVRVMADESRRIYRELEQQLGALGDVDSINAEMVHIKEKLLEYETKYVGLGKVLADYQKQHMQIKLGFQKKIDLEGHINQLDVVGDKMDAVVLQNKVYKAMKLYTKNIKETIISLFMVNITNLANQYLAMDESSSIKISLSIEQKGQNFLINAKQEGSDLQEVSTLSGAEKSTVNRALATAIAFSKKESKYGNYSFDEADSALSQSNKLAFAKNIKEIAAHDMVEQLFIISHDDGITNYLDANRITMERA